MSLIDSVTNTIGQAFTIPDNITNVFISIGSFLDGVTLFFLNVYIIIIILIFFLLVIGLFWLPIKAYPLYKNNSKLINKIINLK